MLAIFSILLSSLSVPPAEIEGTDVYGEWVTHGHDSVVRISDCGDGTPCGHVVRRLDDEPSDTDGVGTEILSSFQTDGTCWNQGKILDPENNRTYRAVIRRIDETTLRVKGCKGPICKGFHWTLASPATK